MKELDLTGASYHELVKSYRHDLEIINILEASKNELLWTDKIIDGVNINNERFQKKFLIDISKYSESGPNKHPTKNSEDAKKYIGTDYLEPLPANLVGKISLLFLKNDDVYAYEKRCLALIPASQLIYIKSTDKITGVDGALKNEQGLTKHDSFFKVKAVLVLHKNCPVRSLRDLQSRQKTVIPSRSLGVVQSISGEGDALKVLVSFYIQNEEHFVDIGMMSHDSNDEFLLNGVRFQIPLQISYCMTIASSQGLEFDVLVADFNQYANGWLKHSLYTALSRVKSFINLYILNTP